MDKSDYLVYRYFILSTSEQLSIYHNDNFRKEDIIHSVFKKLNSNKKTEFIHRQDKFFIYGIKSYEDNLYFFKIAKEHRSKEYKEGETNIIEEDVNRLEVVNLVCQVSTQLILIQKDTTAFSDSKTPINAFGKFLSNKSSKYDYIISIDEKTSERKFWDYIHNSKGVYTFEMKLNAPNMNLGGEDIRGALKTLKEEFNNDEVDVKLKNSEGNLRIDKSKIGEYIDYISTIGGKYRLVYLSSNGVRRAIDSILNIVKLKFLKDISKEDEKKVDEKLEEISTKKNVEEY